MLKNQFVVVRIAALMACMFMVGQLQQAKAALVAYTDFAAYTAAIATAGGGTTSVIDFESFTAGTDITAPISDAFDTVTIEESFGETLRVYDTFATETWSPDNYVGYFDVGFPEQLTENEVIEFEFGSGRSSIGLFVQYDPTNLSNDGILELTVGGDAVTVNVADALVFPTEPTSSDRAFFLGLVEDTGAETILDASLEVDAFGGGISYTFDNFVSSKVVAVPEPSSMAVIALLGGCIAMRRRRG